MPQPDHCKLSICISTFNRAAFIGATLESIIVQATSNCEIVVLDGGSTDDTQRVVANYVRRCDRLRYIRQDTNNGVDRDYDHAVELARGEYCWLMSDDDLLKPGAITAVLNALYRDLSLIVVNVEFKDVCMTTVTLPSYLDFVSDRVYRPGEMDRLFEDTRILLIYLGCVVFKRAIWLPRERARYYGSLFIHVGVIFQERLPGETLVIAEPLISYRTGNVHTFSPRLFEINMFDWPSMVWSLPLSESAKRKVCHAEPWRSLQQLLLYRAIGWYSLALYRSCIRPRVRSLPETLVPAVVAMLPGVLANALSVFYYSFAGRDRRMWLQVLRESRFHMRNWRKFPNRVMDASRLEPPKGSGPPRK